MRQSNLGSVLPTIVEAVEIIAEFYMMSPCTAEAALMPRIDRASLVGSFRNERGSWPGATTVPWSMHGCRKVDVLHGIKINILPKSIDAD